VAVQQLLNWQVGVIGAAAAILAGWMWRCGSCHTDWLNVRWCNSDYIVRGDVAVQQLPYLQVWFGGAAAAMLAGRMLEDRSFHSGRSDTTRKQQVRRFEVAGCDRMK
jgi:hypothetical protein